MQSELLGRDEVSIWMRRMRKVREGVGKRNVVWGEMEILKFLGRDLSDEIKS